MTTHGNESARVLGLRRSIDRCTMLRDRWQRRAAAWEVEGRLQLYSDAMWWIRFYDLQIAKRRRQLNAALRVRDRWSRLGSIAWRVIVVLVKIVVLAVMFSVVLMLAMVLFSSVRCSWQDAPPLAAPGGEVPAVPAEKERTP